MNDVIRRKTIAMRIRLYNANIQIEQLTTELETLQPQLLTGMTTTMPTTAPNHRDINRLSATARLAYEQHNSDRMVILEVKGNYMSSIMKQAPMLRLREASSL